MDDVQKSLRAIAYTRVSTVEQTESGAGLAAQKTAVLGEIDRRGWHLVEFIEDAGASSATLARPGIERALDLLDGRKADVLVVGKLDRLTRSIRDFGELAERARKRGWAITAIDLGVDMTTPAGELVSNVIASTAVYERRMISVRTREGLAAKRAAGVRLGRPPVVEEPTIRRIVALRAAGNSLRAIADHLNRAGVPTIAGKPWTHGGVQSLLRTAAARKLVELDPHP